MEQKNEAAARAQGFGALNPAAIGAQLAAAPHRLMFFAGASTVLLSMLWWACYLAAPRLGHAFPEPPVPAGWAHAMLTQYGMLPLFMFGFLLTVFPRWMNQPALTRRAYVPVFAGLFGGYLLAHAGLLGSKWLLAIGLAAMLAGWIAGCIALGTVLVRNRARDRHALTCFIALISPFLVSTSTKLAPLSLSLTSMMCEPVDSLAITGRPPAERLAGTLAAVGFAADHGAAMVRVHDVAATVDFLAVRSVLSGAEEIGAFDAADDALKWIRATPSP